MGEQAIFSRLKELDFQELSLLSPDATLSRDAIRRQKDEAVGYRQHFSVDADRILHSKAYTRYIDKTQVFSLVKNDHITHRVLHVQLVARIARTIGRFLSLNEDLIEAIALGHDIGHPPFGHEGEEFLSEISLKNGLSAFQHNVQSVRFLDIVENKNLSLQTLDGILCHDGESRITAISPEPIATFAEFDQKFSLLNTIPTMTFAPCTLEGCVVRIADTIAYLGRDIEDAITLDVIKREQLPKAVTEILGNTNGSIVYSLVTDLIENSVVPAANQDSSGAYLEFGEVGSEAIHELKRFNYENIYLSNEIKTDMAMIKDCYISLFDYLKDGLNSNRPKVCSLLKDISYEDNYLLAIRDFMAGMTDDYFLTQARNIGCAVPEKVIL